jgi:hypothetical protein
MGISMNLGAATYYTQLCQFLNWWLAANPPVIHRSAGGDITQKAAWDTNTYWDTSTGELKNPVPSDVVSYETCIYAVPQQSYVTSLGANYAGEGFVLEFTGAGTIGVSGSTSLTAVTANKYTWTADGTQMNLTFTITDRNNPPRNIKVYQSRYATNVANGEVWNPDYLTLAGQWDQTRWLDMQQVNNSHMTDFSQLADLSWNRVAQFFGLYFTPFSGAITNCDIGPKGGIHPSVICSFANLVNKPVHIHIPLHATDAFVTSFATYMRDHTSVIVTYELSNEMWNFGFYTFQECQTLGSTNWPGDAARAYKYAGYRAAQVMKIIRDVYGVGANRAHWKGALATQNANAAILDYNLVGVNAYLTTVGLAPSDVFDDVYGTGYAGDTISSSAIASVLRNTTTTLQFSSDPAWTLKPLDGSVTVGGVYSAQITFSAGSGWSDLSGKYNVTYVSSSAVTIPLDTSGRGAPTVGDNQSYINASMWFDLIAASKANHTSTPSRYPDNYQYFNEQVRDAIITGSAAPGAMVGEHLGTQLTHWSDLKSRCTANGLGLKMYEGGLNWLGDAYLEGFGGNALITEFGMHFARSREGAEVVGAMYQAFLDAGGTLPAKYNQEGAISQYGPWEMVNFGKTAANSGQMDTANAMVLVSQVANSNKRRFKCKTA